MQFAIAVVVEIEVLDVGDLRDGVAHACGDAGVAVEVFAKGLGAVVALAGEKGLEGRERWQCDHFVVGRQAVADPPAAPSEESAHGVVVAEGGGGGGEGVAGAEGVAPLQVRADRTHLFADPCVQRGEADRVGRRPQVAFVLARRRKKKLSRAQLDLVVDEDGARVGVRFDDAGVIAAARYAARVEIEVARRRPLESELRDAGGVVIAFRVRRASGDVALQVEGRLCEERCGDEEREREIKQDSADRATNRRGVVRSRS